jgi:hypothetical protein
MHDEERIFENLERLVMRFGRASRFERLKSLFGPSPRAMLLDIHMQIIEMERVLLGLHRFVETEKAKLLGERLASDLLIYVDQAAKELPSDVSRQIGNVTRLTEAFETSRANNFAVFIAAALSSVATALLTSLVKQ